MAEKSPMKIAKSKLDKVLYIILIINNINSQQNKYIKCYKCVLDKIQLMLNMF